MSIHDVHTPMSASDPWGRPRVGDWIQTRTGKRFHLLDPDPSSFDVEDVAHALSHQCRFTGHTSEFYSVAEHSVRVCRQVMDANPGRRDLAFAALMHDASEAYVSDMARPFKQLPEFAFYRDVEDRLMKHLSARFGFAYPLPSEVHDADGVLLGTEARDLMNPPLDDWHLRYRLQDSEIVPWSPAEAKAAFLSLFDELSPQARSAK